MVRSVTRGNSSTRPTASNVTLSGGALGGSGTMTVSGTLNWTGGTMNGGGTTVIPSGRTEERRVGEVDTGGGCALKDKGSKEALWAALRRCEARVGAEQH